MSDALQDRDVPARHRRRCNDELSDWTEPLGSSTDELQKAYLEIGSWLNQFDASATNRIGTDLLGV